jgi:hypothetical protein
LKVLCACAFRISPYLHERFASAFDAQSVRLVSVKGNHFVLVNSMAMEGDGCFLCRPAELQLQKISSKWRQSSDGHLSTEQLGVDSL